jgi:uncharacterized protein YjbI with pentapeptide repeats
MWDWLDLLIVPAILILAVAWWNSEQAGRDQRRQDQLRQDTTLESYYQQMSDLVLREHLLRSKLNQPVQTVADTVTNATLSRLSDQRKIEVLRFLFQSGLLEGIVDVSDADLAGADLTEYNFEYADLQYAHLQHANFRGAVIYGDDLSYARLGHANLEDVFAVNSSFRRADLGNADLKGANLGSAQLQDADLRGTDLRGGNLAGAVFWGAKLKDANFEHAGLGLATSKRSPTPDPPDFAYAHLKGARNLDLGAVVSSLSPESKKCFLVSQRAFLNSLSSADAAEFNLPPAKLAELRSAARTVKPSETCLYEAHYEPP